MLAVQALTVLLLGLSLLPAYAYIRSLSKASHSALQHNAIKPRSYPYPAKPKSPPSGIDHRSIKDGCLVQYLTSKGMKALALVNKRKGSSLEAINAQMFEFSVSVAAVSYVIEGTYSFSDLVKLDKTISSFTLDQVKGLWEFVSDSADSTVNLQLVSDTVFGSIGPLSLFASSRLMGKLGGVFFETLPLTDANGALYSLLPVDIVRERLEQQDSFEDFKVAFKIKINKDGQGEPSPSVPLLDGYAEGLKEIVAESHMFMGQHGVFRKFDATAIAKAKELLLYLDLAPTSKSAKKVLEITGLWPAHSYVEKYINLIRYDFPSEVLQEATRLLTDCESIPDSDADIRRDLSHLACYSIDREGAAEVDDAVSVEVLPDGTEKLWTHISDVSRWILPGSPLCLEAEMRVTSIYLPEETVSMFPEQLSLQLLSLGAKDSSFAVSCGVVLDSEGEVVSVDICPSKIGRTQRLTYIQLESILGGENPDGLGSIEPLRGDIEKLDHWARLRGDFRREKRGAIDDYLKHKTELQLSVSIDNNDQPVIASELTYCDLRSNNFVAEFMLLMSECVGGLCVDLGAPVWFKVQVPLTPLGPTQLALEEGETPFQRSRRLVRCLKGAMDSKRPGYHVTSGSSTYVHCTSPIRRYADLVNHYHFKAALRARAEGESPSVEGASERASEQLEGVRSNTDKANTLSAARMVQRSRALYWQSLHLKGLADTVPRVEFDGVIIGAAETEGSPPPEGIYDVAIFQLGTFKTHRLFCPPGMLAGKGEAVRCHVIQVGTKPGRPDDFLFVPLGLGAEDIPVKLR